MVNRRGASSLGCLTSLLMLAAALYVGVHVGEPYFRYLQLRDAARQEARFASIRNDDAIKRTLRATADSLDLPNGAPRIHVQRTARAIRIRTNYVDAWSIGPYARPVRFRLDVRAPL